jgi:hypothetical protein
VPRIILVVSVFYEVLQFVSEKFQIPYNGIGIKVTYPREENMKTPAQYQHEFNELTAIQLKDLDESARKELIEKLTHLENQVALDLRSLSVQFQARAISQLNNSNFKAGKGKATAEKQLMEDQNSKLKPYQDILEKIKDLVKKPE